ncbi:MAG: hypothetical protein IPH62_14335 [Ignavibacteriae bacterium]|nr:hypothetical protein [Ignavibacteriota bacterium]
MKNFFKIFYSLILLTNFFSGCGSLNPINDFFGIHMNIDEEQNFKIVKYNEIDGISYQNSISMDPKINAWSEITSNEIVLKIINNSNQEIPLNYTVDQFILITNEKEYNLGKGERADYISKSIIPVNSSQTFILELPINYTNISQNLSNKSETELTKEILRDYSKTGNKLNVDKENIKYIIARIGSSTILLKKVPQDN